MRRGLEHCFGLSLINRSFFFDERGGDILPSDIGGFPGSHLEGQVVDERLKRFIPSDEVGFTVDFDEHTDFSAHVNIGMDEALVRFAAGFFECGRQALLAEVIDGFLNIVAILGEGSGNRGCRRRFFLSVL